MPCISRRWRCARSTEQLEEKPHLGEDTLRSPSLCTSSSYSHRAQDILHLLQPHRAALRLPGRSIDILPTAAAEPAELVVEHGVSMDHRTMTEREIFVMPQRWSCYMVDENWLRLRASDGMGPCGRRWVSRSHIYPCRLVDIHILFSLLLIFYFQ